jgi:protein pelota
MRIIKKRINKKTKAGSFILLPNDEEDLWYLYNLIVPGDVMSLKTFRKIKSEGKGQYSMTKVIRKELKLEVSVMDVDFSADEKGVSLFVKCKNIKENQYVALGQMQNISINLYKPIMIFKEYWNRQCFKLINDSVNESKRFDSLILLCKEGYCGFYILKNSLTILNSKLTKSMPKKRSNLMEVFNKKCKEFNQTVFNHLVTKYDISSLKLIVLAGPGSMKYKLYEMMKNANIVVKQSRNQQTKKKAPEEMITKKSKKKKSNGKSKKQKKEAPEPSSKKKVIKSHQLIIVNTSSALKSALDEVLKDEKVMYQLNNTKAFLETQVLEEFYEIFSKNSSQAVYGKKEVNFAISQGAIRKFLICDSLLRSKNFNKRKEYLRMYNQCVKQCNAENIFVLSENHYSGQKLKEITGVAAILRFDVDINQIYGNSNDSETESESDSESEDESIEKTETKKSESGIKNSLFMNNKEEEKNINYEEARKHFEEFNATSEKEYEWTEDFM